MLYGYDNTFHRTGHLDVETDQEGKVVAVWFRCQTLPFEQHYVDNYRAESMRSMYIQTDCAPPILAVDLKQKSKIVMLSEEKLAVLRANIASAYDCLNYVSDILRDREDQDAGNR